MCHHKIKTKSINNSKGKIIRSRMFQHLCKHIAPPLIKLLGVPLTSLCMGTGPRSAVGNVSGYRCVSDCNPGVASSIPARSHTFVEMDHEIISTVILLPSADSFKKGCCQLQAKVCARITGYPLVQACPGKSVVR